MGYRSACCDPSHGFEHGLPGKPVAYSMSSRQGTVLLVLEKLPEERATRNLCSLVTKAGGLASFGDGSGCAERLTLA